MEQQPKRPPTILESNIEALLARDQIISFRLNSNEFADVISLIVIALFEKNGASGITVDQCTVTITDAMATVEIITSIQKPVTARFTIRYLLTNDAQTRQLMASNIEIQTKASFVAKAALSLANVEEQIKTALSDLNALLLENPPPILVRDGISITTINATLENGQLAVQLTSD